jgi:DNA-binding beta-propeller fold protein YncE
MGVQQLALRGAVMQRFSLFILGLCVFSTVQAARAGDRPPLVLERTIALPNVSGRIDHLAYDGVRKCLMVAELGNNTVDIIDLSAGTVLHRITGLKEPQGIAYLPEPNMIVTANADGGDVRFFDGTSFLPRGSVGLGDDADNVRLDTRNGHVLVGYGDGGIAIIDPVRAAKIGDISLGAHPESFQLSLTAGRLFANVPDARRIAVVDLTSGRQIASWSPTFRGNFPMAIDDSGHAVIVVFRNPARLAALDMNTGAPTASVATCSDADDVFLDNNRQRIYVSCGAGVIDVVARNGLKRIAYVKTTSGARTSLYVPETDRIYLATRAGLISGQAAIQVYRPVP